MILSCGEALIDLFPSSEDGKRWEATCGGSPLNVAVAASRLGASAALATHLSTDRFGFLLTGHLEASGVSLEYALRTDTPTTLAIVDQTPNDPEPHFSFYAQGTTASTLDPGALELPESVGIVHASGSVSLVLEPAATTYGQLLAAFKGRSLVTIDPNPRPLIAGSRAAYQTHLTRWFGLADLMKTSRADLQWIDPGRDPIETAATWLRRGPEVVVVTQGPGPAVVLREGGRVTVAMPEPDGPIVDTVGAGDSFTGGLLAWLAGNDITSTGALSEMGDGEWRDAIAFAGSVAVKTVTRAGADPPRRSEL